MTKELVKRLGSLKQALPSNFIPRGDDHWKAQKRYTPQQFARFEDGQLLCYSGTFPASGIKGSCGWVSVIMLHKILGDMPEGASLSVESDGDQALLHFQAGELQGAFRLQAFEKPEKATFEGQKLMVDVEALYAAKRAGASSVQLIWTEDCWLLRATGENVEVFFPLDKPTYALGPYEKTSPPMFQVSAKSHFAKFCTRLKKSGGELWVGSLEPNCFQIGDEFGPFVGSGRDQQWGGLKEMALKGFNAWLAKGQRLALKSSPNDLEPLLGNSHETVLVVEEWRKITLLIGANGTVFVSDYQDTRNASEAA